jgi:hypothetical protein
VPPGIRQMMQLTRWNYSQCWQYSKPTSNPNKTFTSLWRPWTKIPHKYSKSCH